MKQPKPILSSHSRKGTHQAFTLLELLVIVATVAALLVLASSGLGSARDGSQTVRCLNNHHQLITAWQMYADDNKGMLVMNFHGGQAFDGAAGNDPANSPWACGWLDWTTRGDNTNLAFITEEKYSRLAIYYNRDPLVYQCPADRYVSAAQRSAGWARRVRSYAANAAIGGGNWLTGPADSIYRHVQNINDFVTPGPGNTFVFLEEHPDSIQDPGFFPPYSNRLLDAPANYHNGACAVTFADGHSGLHGWEGAAIEGRTSRVLLNGYSGSQIPVRTNDPDIHWLSFHSPRYKDKSY
jgi:prepilin-type processing-associated H-X9-DG protein